MRWSPLAAFAILGLVMSSTLPAAAQATQPGTAAPTTRAPTTTAPKAAKPKREPTAGQMAARERQRKCGAEWKDAKAKGTTGGLKWPQYWSKCNARMKGNAA